MKKGPLWSRWVQRLEQIESSAVSLHRNHQRSLGNVFDQICKYDTVIPPHNVKCLATSLCNLRKSIVTLYTCSQSSLAGATTVQRSTDVVKYFGKRRIEVSLRYPLYLCRAVSSSLASHKVLARLAHQLWFVLVFQPISDFFLASAASAGGTPSLMASSLCPDCTRAMYTLARPTP